MRAAPARFAEKLARLVLIVVLVGSGAGGYAGATVPGYPPLPGTPVPIWSGGGAGVSAAGFVPHAAVGVHVPLARRLRFDVEAGAAWPVRDEERRLAPQLAVGVSYAFATDVRPAGVDPSEARARGDRGAAACEPGPPDPALLGAAFDRAVDAILDDVRATYGSLYRAPATTSTGAAPIWTGCDWRLSDLDS